MVNAPCVEPFITYHYIVSGHVSGTVHVVIEELGYVAPILHFTVFGRETVSTCLVIAKPPLTNTDTPL